MFILQSCIPDVRFVTQPVTFTENYQRLELEKKSRRIQKTVYRGPVIRYHSLTMPLIEEVQDNEINIEQDRYSPIIIDIGILNSCTSDREILHC